MVHTFCVSLVSVALVSHYWSWLWSLLHPNWLTFDIDVLNLHNIPPAYIVLAFLIAWIARVSKLHDRISDCFGIRERFDLHEILIPLANGVGVLVDLDKRKRVLAVRNDLMRRVFYKYASSTNPVIDQHLIWTALDKWSWFWICIELTAVTLLAYVILLAIGAFKIAAWVGLVVIAGILLATQINRSCARVAHAQIRDILDDPTRVQQIATVFNAL